MSTFGTLFRVTTFGESHCKGVGAIVDGVPARMCARSLPAGPTPALRGARWLTSPVCVRRAACRALTEADIQPQLTRRRPGQSRLTTPRAEKDLVTIMSGTEFGHTLGTPIGLLVMNEDQRPGDYKEMSEIPRPGHADFTYQIKYGTRASSGGGRSSARETIGRVAAGAIAEKWLAETYGTEISCWVSSIGSVEMPDSAVPLCEGSRGWTREEVDKLGCLRMLRNPRYWRTVSEAEEPDAAKRTKMQMQLEIEAEEQFLAALSGGTDAQKELSAAPAYEDWQGLTYNHEGVPVPAPPSLAEWQTDELLPLRCPHPPTACRMATLIRQVKSEKDSIGGTVACCMHNVPPALGEPVFDRLEAKLAHAMLSLPATKVGGMPSRAATRPADRPRRRLPPPPRRRRASSSARASPAPACEAPSTTTRSCARSRRTRPAARRSPSVRPRRTRATPSAPQPLAPLPRRRPNPSPARTNPPRARR